MLLPPDQPLALALYDKELGERDLLRVNAHTGKEPSPNPWIHFRREEASLPVAIFTDRCLEQVITSKHAVNIAWLLESPGLMKSPLRRLKSLQGNFDRILTSHRSFLKRGPPYQKCATAGSWIADEEWALYPKSRQLSIIASTKRYLPGHKLRFAIVKRHRNCIDGLFGFAFERLDAKLDGLRDFRFSFAIENCRKDYYFTEKLIDCFATATIPIYWGCPSIARFFDPEGMIIINKLRDLDAIVPQLNEAFYESRKPAIRRNFERAKAYRMVEMHLYAAIHGWSFEGTLLD